jgi:hypothetical protein
VRLIKPVIISVAGARNEHRHAIRRSDETGKNRLEQTLKGCLVEFDREQDLAEEQLGALVLRIVKNSSGSFCSTIWPCSP